MLSVNLGLVVGTKNVNNLNVLKIIPIGTDKDEEPLDASYGTPFGGAGYGFVATPSKGATVLYVDVRDVSEAPYDCIWFSCVYDPTMPVMHDAHTEVDNSTPEQIARTQVDNVNVGSGPKNPLMGSLPENSVLFSDDGHNESVLLKSRSGHKLKLAHKVSDQRCEDAIELQGASGKFIKIDDGHQDGIFVQDDKAKDPNRREIFTKEDKIRDYAGRDIESISREGSHTTTILDGVGTIYRDNLSEGDIKDLVTGNGVESKGNYNLDANHDITRISRTGDVLEDCQLGNTTQLTHLDHTINVGGNAFTTIDLDYKLVVHGNTSIDVDGSTSLNSIGSITITTSALLNISSTFSTSISAGTSMSISAVTNLDMTSIGPMNIHSNGPMVISSLTGIIIQAPRVDVI